MNIADVYGKINQLGLVGSQVEFSKVWLGRSSRYYSNLVAVQREPGLGTLCGIVWRLETIAAHASNDQSKALLELKRQLDSLIVGRAMGRNPARPSLRR